MNRPYRLPAALRSRGLSLIEVLVAVLLLGFGLVAVALLQTSAIQNNFVSNQYTTAASLAQGLSEAMRANRTGVVNGNYDSLAATAPANPAVNCAVATCLPVQRAKWDLAIAYSAINAAASYSNIPAGPTGLLPSGILQVQCADATCAALSPRIITLYWDADRSGATGTNCDPTSSSDLKCFRLVHVP